MMLSLSPISVLSAIVCLSCIAAVPVDVNHDTRPIVGAIAPEEEKPVVGDEAAVLEVEGIPSKGITFYDQSHLKYAGFVQKNAVPVVDITQEHEKYGNDGYRAFDHKLIDAYEGLANIINKLIDSPRQIAKGFSNSFTEKLNQFGGKIVGL